MHLFAHLVFAHFHLKILESRGIGILVLFQDPCSFTDFERLSYFVRMSDVSLSEALVELPKAEAVIANVAVVKKGFDDRKKAAKEKQDKMIKKAREAYAKKMLDLKYLMKLDLKRAADEASVALKTAKKLRKMVYEPEVYESRTKLTDVLWIVAKNGYAREANACAGLNRETWTYLPPEMSDEDKDRVRKTNMFWQAIINLKHGFFKKTRLSWAAGKGKLARVRELCDWRAGIEEADKDGRTPLYYASQFNNLYVVRDLLDRGANIEAATYDGNTSLYVASERAHLDVVRELLARGANKEAAKNDGVTSLIIAVMYGHVEVLRELLAHGANIEAAKKNGSTPLMIASQCGNTDLVRELIARGANIEAGDDIGSTPLIYASWAGHADVVRELLASGANKHHVDNDGETAMSLVGRLASFEHLVIRALLARAQ